MKKLNLFHCEKFVGIITEDDDERLEFKYADSWIADKESFSLSFALKMRSESYGHLLTKSFFENLLPEGELRKILEKMSIDPIDNEFNFLKKHGIDCAGAFIVTSATEISHSHSFKRKEISLETIYKYLDAKKGLAESIISHEGGRFSLAGAQDKFPIIFQKSNNNGHKFYIPLDGEPTTHILKPSVLSFADSIDSPYNEYFCMTLAKAIAVNVPNVYIIDGKYPLYLIERFDRLTKKDNKSVTRIHTQDFCQAQGLTSHKKYEEEGGPTIAQNYRFIKNSSSLPLKDLDQFLRWFWFNLLIGNNDCHSKNLSLINTPTGVRLAPFYDLLCTIIYKELSQKFSYSIGGQFYWFKLKNKHFEKLALDLEIKSESLFKIGTEVIGNMETVLDREVISFEQRFIGLKTAQKIKKEICKRIDHFQKNVPKLSI